MKNRQPPNLGAAGHRLDLPDADSLAALRAVEIRLTLNFSHSVLNSPPARTPQCSSAQRDATPTISRPPSRRSPPTGERRSTGSASRFRTTSPERTALSQLWSERLKLDHRNGDAEAGDYARRDAWAHGLDIPPGERGRAASGCRLGAIVGGLWGERRVCGRSASCCRRDESVRARWLR